MKKAACTLKLECRLLFGLYSDIRLMAWLIQFPSSIFIHNKKCRLLSNKTKSSLHLILNGVVIVYAKSANSAVER